MRYVYFKTLKLSNFLSVGKKPVEINFKSGLNIITGKNYDKADTYVNKSPLTPLFQRGESGLTLLIEQNADS